MTTISVKEQKKTDYLNLNWMITVLIMALAFSPFWMLMLI